MADEGSGQTVNSVKDAGLSLSSGRQLHLMKAPYQTLRLPDEILALPSALFLALKPFVCAAYRYHKFVGKKKELIFYIFLCFLVVL